MCRPVSFISRSAGCSELKCLCLPSANLNLVNITGGVTLEDLVDLDDILARLLKPLRSRIDRPVVGPQRAGGHLADGKGKVRPRVC